MCLLLCVAWLAATPSPVSASPIAIVPYSGVTIFSDSLSLPAPVDQTQGSGLGPHTANVHVVTINLKAPGIGFKVSPDNGPAAGETLTQTTLAFLNQEHAQLAVNANFFNFTTNSAVNTTLTGFAASNGTVYSSFEAAPLANALLPYALTANAPALNIGADNTVRILGPGASQETLAGGVLPYNAVSGSDQVITNGVKTLPALVTTVSGPHQIVAKTVPPFGAPALGNWYTDQIAARTAIGLSQDNQSLYIFTADAAPGSNGMTVSEMADYLMANFGIFNLINLDGGGSTSLAMVNPDTHVAGLINSVNGAQRFVGNSLAIYAAPIPEPSAFVLMMSGIGVLIGLVRRAR